MTGPGGTELLVRPGSAPRVKPALPPAPEHSPCHLRQAVENAKRAMEHAGEVPSPALREKLDLALYRRQQFWLDTCYEVREMKIASPHVLELHRQHGCRFFAPSPRQVQQILDALDSALNAWDRDHPELFYQTLEMNFPELSRLCRVQRAR